MPTRPLTSASDRAVPIEYSGNWVGWNSDHTKIVAHSDSMKDLWEVVREKQIQDPVFEKIPKADVRFIGREGGKGARVFFGWKCARKSESGEKSPFAANRSSITLSRFVSEGKNELPLDLQFVLDLSYDGGPLSGCEFSESAVLTPDPRS